MNTTDTLQEKNKKREYLTPAEIRAMKKLIASYSTKEDALKAIGTNHVTMNNALDKGFASSQTVKKFRKAINPTN